MPQDDLKDVASQKGHRINTNHLSFSHFWFYTVFLRVATGTKLVTRKGCHTNYWL